MDIKTERGLALASEILPKIAFLAIAVSLLAKLLSEGTFRSVGQ